ncbi:TonB-dependent receptor [Phenylobacterium sp. LjRoot225]|uniref:TonB-dependent receptor n=1 Tax=Phenylobacterium sp. LjRoot225 TaxID=3342285 RepID=UPI003ECFF5EC
MSKPAHSTSGSRTVRRAERRAASISFDILLSAERLSSPVLRIGLLSLDATPAGEGIPGVLCSFNLSVAGGLIAASGAASAPESVNNATLHARAMPKLALHHEAPFSTDRLIAKVRRYAETATAVTGLQIGSLGGNMKRFICLALASASVTAISSVAVAQPAATSSGDNQLSEIVVTARRREESLQTVPQTVNAVTGSTLERLNIRQFDEVQTVVPGLNLTNNGNGFSTAATIRGAPFQAESGAQPTVAFYLNDATIQSVYAFQSMFDVGQIEVLRGPQGTLRGQSAPSGSITLATRRPTLGDFGAYGNLTVTDQHARNLNGAVNVPVVRDVLAFRLAGIIDDNRGDGVNSINSTIQPSSKTWAVRPSVSLELGGLTVDAMYQHLDKRVISYAQVVSVSELDPSLPAAQALIDAGDRVGLTNDDNHFRQKQDLVTVNAAYRFAGQKLSYVGSYSKSNLLTFGSQDNANIFTTGAFGQLTHSLATQTTNEIRLSSDDRLFGFVDYTVGGYAQDFHTPTDVTQQTAVTLFGALRAVVETPIFKTGKTHERSIFGNATVHIGDATELSGGLRKLWYRDVNDLTVNGARLMNDQRSKAEATLYNISLSHRFTSDFMVYANTGSAFRPGPFVTGVFRPLTPALLGHIDLENEKSKSYELGFKSTFFDKRVLLNAAVFHQDFKNFINRGPSVYYVNVNQVGPSVSSFNFGNSVDAKIDGIDVDASWQVMRGLNISGAVSYAKSKIKNQLVACNDLNGDGVPDVLTQAPTLAQLQAATGAGALSECLSNDALQYTPKWNLTLQSEYSRPVREDTDAFVRGLFTYRPKTQGDPGNKFDSVDAFGLLNLYGGVRAQDGAWELSLFVKNIFNTGKVLTAENGIVGTSIQALQPPTFRTTASSTVTAPYVKVTTTAPREIGVNLRYAFGSR